MPLCFDEQIASKTRHSCRWELLAWEVGALMWRAGIPGWEGRRTSEREKMGRGYFFSISTVWSINQCYLPSTEASSPPALWRSLPGQTWVHFEVGWRSVTHSPRRSLLGLTTKTCQDRSSSPEKEKEKKKRNALKEPISSPFSMKSHGDFRLA